jgi:hypothetical protein
VKARINALDDGTVTIVIDAEETLEREMLKVFYAQTYAKKTPAKVLRLGASCMQLHAADRADGEGTEGT